MTDHPPEPRADHPPQKPRRRGLVWAWVPVLVFGVQGVVLAVTISLATGRGIHAVEPDYYQRSLEWDDHAALLHNAERLGWRVHLGVSDPSGPLMERDVTVTVTGDGGMPVRGAVVSLEMFHHAYAGDRTELDLQPDAEVTAHSARVPMQREGLWEVRVRIRRGPEQALVVEQIELRA